MVQLQKLLELGEKSDDLARVAFSGEVFTTIVNLFPDREMLKLSQKSELRGKYTKERMRDIL